MRSIVDRPGFNHGSAGYTLGCGCETCRTEKVATVRAYRAAQRDAVRWLRAHHPGVWDRLLDDAYAEAGLERRPVGRPPKPGLPYSYSELDWDR